MSEKKKDVGRLYHKLHQLQKRVTRWFTNSHTDKVNDAIYKEKKILEKIRKTHKSYGK